MALALSRKIKYGMIIKKEGVEMWTIIWIYLVLINIAAFILCWKDKRSAHKQSRRISEKNLFLSAILGGCVGFYMGMLTFRHKTQHWYFVWGIPGIIVIWAGLLLCVARFTSVG